MLTLMNAQHGRSLLTLNVSVEGFYLAMENGDDRAAFNWKVPAFPLELTSALDAVLFHDHGSSAFNCDHYTVVGVIAEILDTTGVSERGERFFMLTITHVQNKVSIKLRYTEVLKFQESLEKYWTC